MPATAWKSPGTCENVDRDGKVNWVNPNNAKVSDDSDAVTQPNKTDYSDWLRCTNFGFTTSDIPSGSTIVGIELDIEKCQTAEYIICDSSVRLRKSTGQVGDDKASATEWPTTDTYVTHGGSSDDWNAGLSDSDIRSTGFGMDLSVLNTAITVSMAEVDHVRIKVHYTTPAGGVFRHPVHTQGLARF